MVVTGRNAPEIINPDWRGQMALWRIRIAAEQKTQDGAERIVSTFLDGSSFDLFKEVRVCACPLLS